MDKRTAVVLYAVAMVAVSRCRFHVLQKPILGTTDSEYWHCLAVRSFLLEIPHASMIAMEVNAGGPIALDVNKAKFQCPLLG